MKQLTVAVTVCLLTASHAQAADSQIGRNLAATCANCHGTNGQAVKDSGLARLAGMEKTRILQKLAEFKSGDQAASIMHQIARGYTEEQLDLIATYYTRQQ